MLLLRNTQCSPCRLVHQSPVLATSSQQAAVVQHGRGPCQVDRVASYKQVLNMQNV